MSAATFDCPHCGATYPLKPVLIGKTVRCTSCKNAFRLRADGVADKVDQATARVAAPVPPTPVPPTPAAAAPAPTAAAQPEVPNRPGKQSARLQTTTPKAGLTKQQLEARKAMADSLKATMDDALGLDDLEAPAAVPGKPGTERKSKSGTERNAKSSGYLKPAGKKPAKTPAVLTNEGEREAANNRRWLVGALVVAMVVGLLIWVANRTDERSAAVAAFTAELPASERRYGARIEAIQARGWMAGITPFIDLPAPRLGAQHEIPAASLEPLGKLKGLTYVASAERWVTPAVATWLAKQPPAEKEKSEAKLERDGAIQVTAKALRKALAAGNLGDDEMTIVMRLLTQPAASAGAPNSAELLTQGRLPAIRWCTVSGQKGLYLTDPGQGYRTETADYHGLLVAFRGEGWPAGWRFVTLAPVR